MWKYQKKLPGEILMKFPWTNLFENSSKNRTSLYLLRFSPDCPQYGRDQIHISMWTHLCENIKRNFPVKFSWNSRVLTFWEFVKNSNFIISATIQSRLPQIWSWPNSYIHRDPFMWKYQKKLPGQIFMKFPCTNPFENSSKLELHYICSSDSVLIAPNMVVTKFIYP